MRGLLALVLTGALAAPAQAYCRLALSLAIDVSSSVDDGEYALQKRGLVAALGAREVVEAFLAIPGGHVMLHVYEWSGRYQQEDILGWTAIRTEADIVAAQAHLAAAPRTHAAFPTALGYGVAHATFDFRKVPECEKRTIDVSGDGLNNVGFTPREATRSHDFTNTTVNGLVIGRDPKLYEHYRDEVILGPGAFIEVADDFADYGRAMRRKLVRELGVMRLGKQ